MLRIRIGKIRGHNGIIRNFQFRKFLPAYSNHHAFLYDIGISSLENRLSAYGDHHEMLSAE